jgi:ABC-type Fe3+/spermidine/putrescine transport system ATPase subunit
MNRLEVQSATQMIGHFQLYANFHVDSHEIMGIQAPSGFGKTSLFRMILGAMPLKTGSVVLNGLNITTWPVEKREIGILFQQPVLFNHLSVLENLTFALRLQGLSKPQREEVGRSWLKKLKIQSSPDRLPVNLSGGEQQRIALGRSLLAKPKALLLDEPWSALDESLKKELQGLVKDLHSADPIPCLVVSHQEADLRAICTGRLRCDESLSADNTLQRRFLR